MKQNEEEYYVETMREALKDAYDIVSLPPEFGYAEFDWGELDEEDLEAIKEFNQLHKEEGIQAFYEKDGGVIHVNNRSIR